MLKYSLRRTLIVIITVLIFVSMFFFGYGSKFNFLSNSSNNIINVGKLGISNKLFMTNYNMFIQQNAYIIQQNPYMINNIIQSMVSKYVSSLMFINEAQTLGLGVDDSLIYKIIANSPYFKDSSGNFNKDVFNKQISAVYGSEEQYIDILRNEIKKNQLVGVLFSSVTLSDKVALYNYLSLKQTRNISYIKLTYNDVINQIKAPTDKELLAIRDKNKQIFTKPEYRKVEVIEFSPLDYVKDVKVSDQDIANYYNDNKNNYLTEETRNISQILVSKKNQADKLYDSLKNKKSLNNKDLAVINLKNVNKNDLPVELSQVVFSAKTGDILAPVKTSLGYHIVLIDKINTAVPLPISKVSPKIKQILLANKLSDTYDKLKQDINNASTSSLAFSAVAKKFNGDLKSVNSVNKYGYDDNNIVVASIAQNKDLLESIFTLPAGKSSEVIEANAKLYLVKVTGVSKEYIEPLNEARKLLTARYNSDKISQALNAKSDSIMKSIIEGKKINSFGYKVITTNLSRSKSEKKDFSQDFVENVFLTRVKSPVQTVSADGSVVVAVVNSISNINPNAVKNTSDLNNIKSYYTDSLKEDIMVQLFEKLNKDYKVKVNEKMLVNNFNLQGKK